MFSSDRLKPLKENQSCHKRKVSSSYSPSLSSPPPPPLILSPCFSPSPLFFPPLSWESLHLYLYTSSLLCLSSCFRATLFFLPNTHTHTLTQNVAALGQDRGCMCDAWINSRGYPGKKEPLVTELILDQPSLTRRAQGLFVQIKELTLNQGQLTWRAETV